MVDLDVDPELLLLIPFGVATAVSLELVSATAVPVVDLSETLLTTGNIEWSVARVGALLILLFALFNRDKSLRETSGIDLWLTYATLGLVAAPPFVGALESLVVGGSFASIVAWTAQNTGYTLITLVN